MEDFQTIDLEEGPSRRSHPRFIWVILIGLGLLVYELTAQPALGVALASIKFGWNDFLAARWFRRTDSDSRRGRTYFWLYLASSFWKIAITATILMFVTVFVHFTVAERKPQDPPPIEFAVACITAFVCFVCSSFASLIAFGKAWRHGVQIWLGPEPHRARRQGVWPPMSDRKTRENKAGCLLITGLALSVTTFTILAVVILVAMLSDFFPGLQRRLGAHGNAARHDVADTAIFVFMLVFVIGGACAILGFKDSLERRFLARAPEDCWDPEEEPAQLENHSQGPESGER